MAGVVNILAQLAAPAGVETLLYQTPAGSKALVQELSVCNRTAAAASFRFSVSLLGVPTTPKDFLYFDLPINGNDNFANDMGLTLNAGDAIRVFASNANLSFTLFGNPT